MYRAIGPPWFPKLPVIRIYDKVSPQWEAVTQNETPPGSSMLGWVPHDEIAGDG